MKKSYLILLFVLMSCSQMKPVSFSKKPLNVDQDQNLWLENVTEKKALDWSRAQNEKTFKKLKGDPRFKEIEKEILEVYEDPEKIPYIFAIKKGLVYNFWRDKQHIQGILRRTTFQEYVKKDPQWETLIDFDELSRQEGKKWVYKGMSCLSPEETLCMIRMSDGGSDAAYSREYDFDKKEFVTENAFYVPESKHRVAWKDRDTVYIGYSFDKDSLTDSGYPRDSRIWKRGTSLKQARKVFEGEKKDVSVGAWRPDNPAHKFTIFYRGLDFYTQDLFVLFDGQEKMVKIEKPRSTEVEGIFQDYFILKNREAWKPDPKSGITEEIPAGSLIALKIKAVRNADYKKSLSLIWSPDESSSIESISFLRSSILLNVIRDVQGEAYKVLKDKQNWKLQKLDLPEKGTLSFMASSFDRDDLLFSYESFLQPESLSLLNLNNGKKLKLKSKKAYFDSSKYTTEQLWAKSRDGVKIPYFIVHSKDMKLDGQNPTYMYGYGGFEISLNPYYSADLGKQWLDKGGVYVLTNIRGGGEYGPRWHQAALKEKRQTAYNDFHSIAEDLISRKITNPKKLAIAGGSNGGLLMGVVFTQRPDLYHAVACAVPLLDMMRFHKLLAGASWMAEYGDPDNAKEKEYLLRYSPYHNVFPDIQYPEVFFFTSTKDDRVHPGHARKMVARMIQQGHPVLYYENIEGGHGGAANLKQSAARKAMQYVYFRQKVMD